jgi:hypothetical protein
MNNIGQSFDDFMMEQGIYDEAKELAAKKLIAFKLKAEMDKQKITKTVMAKRMKTSRVTVDNVLNPAYNTSIGTLERAASALGKELAISLH